MRDLSQLWGVDDWVPYFKALKDPAEPVDEETEELLEVLETGIPLGVLPSTPKRILRRAGEAGFTMEGYESRVQVHDTFYKTGDKAGELKKAAFEQRNIFLGGYMPDSLLRFYATWLGGKFSAHIYDPVGRYRGDVRETYWLEKSSREFEKWMQGWDDMLQVAALAKKEKAA